MAAFFPDKRTRSQLTLPDNLFHLPLDRSPLKDARTRLQSEPPASTMHDASESDDELLLSPSPSKKRAASPWRVNDYASNAAIGSDFPAVKRFRREEGDIEGDYENTVATPTQSTRLATEASHRGASSSPDKHRRAQSVPAFPMIDLRNPPSSASKRQRSRSPSRPLPELVHKPIPLPTIQEPSNSPRPNQPSDITGNKPDDGAQQTPARMSSYNDLEMSPLTPLPETPASADNASNDDSAMDVDATPTAMVSSASLPSLPKFNPVSRIPSSSKLKQPSTSKPTPAPKNAFTFMMAKAKGAAKEPPASKAPSTTATARKGKEKVAPKAATVKAPPRSSLKTGMKAKTKAAPKLFVPPVQDDEDGGVFSESRPSTSNEGVGVQDEPVQPTAVTETEITLVTTESIAEDSPSSMATNDFMNPDAPLFTDSEDDDLTRKDEQVVDEHPAPEQSLPVDPSPPNVDVAMDIVSDAAVPETVNAATPSQSVTPSESSMAVVPPSLPVERKPESDSKKSLKAGASKKKQMTSGLPRVTRGSLKKKEQQAEKAGQAPRSTVARKKALISVAQASPKKADLRKSLSPLSDSADSDDAPVASTSSIRVPQTPAKVPSFAKPTQSSLAKTPAPPRSPSKSSPTKLARPATLVTRPAKTYAFQTDSDSLLNQFFSKVDELKSSISHTPGLPHPPGVPRSAPSLQRSVTHESALFNKAGPSSARPNGIPSTSKAGQQRSIADFVDVKSNDANPVAKRMMTGRGKPIFPNKATFKVSQKTPLAAVPGSPVKGSYSVVDLSGDGSFESESGESNTARMTLLAARTHDDELKGMLDNALNRKGKRKASPEEEKEEQEDSKRVSTAEAFSNLRLTMGPPATPPRRGLRSASSTIPSSASLPTLELYARPHSALATVRPAEGDDEGLPSDDEEVDVGDLIYDKNYHGGSKKHKGSLTVLSHVRAFVDVRDAHTSRDSGEAFVEFLEELGAKVFKKLTKTCTHIVFKNGSFSTVSKWKAAETKPLVVRISWVTECVNRKEHVAEDEHLIDISGLFPSGVDPKNKVHKRRSSRSGHVSSDGADESCDISMDSSSQPLEVARHRRRDSRESGYR